MKLRTKRQRIAEVRRAARGSAEAFVCCQSGIECTKGVLEARAGIAEAWDSSCSESGVIYVAVRAWKEAAEVLLAEDRVSGKGSDVAWLETEQTWKCGEPRRPRRNWPRLGS